MLLFGSHGTPAAEGMDSLISRLMAWRRLVGLVRWEKLVDQMENITIVQVTGLHQWSPSTLCHLMLVSPVFRVQQLTMTRLRLLIICGRR
jgi:hypothetical protein